MNPNQKLSKPQTLYLHNIQKPEQRHSQVKKLQRHFSEKKVHCSQVSNGNKNGPDHESFYQNNKERLLHLNPQD